jgi:hypothetical protein
MASTVMRGVGRRSSPGSCSGGSRWGVEPIRRVLEIAPTTYWSAKVRPPAPEHCEASARDGRSEHVRGELELGPLERAIVQGRLL